jgi:hypothetical protein
MTLLLLFKNKVGPVQFSQFCLLLSALWLIIIYPSMIWFCPDKLPREMKPGEGAVDCDFNQYYVGAIVVRYGIWDSLYPIPKPDVYNRPNHFVPQYQTFIFNSSSASTNPAFYPAVNLPEASDCAPKLITRFPQVGYWRYIYPPPAALFLWPLSFVSFDCAANHLWPTISIWFLFGVSFFASRIHRLLCQTDSYTEGLIVLACVMFSYRGRTHIWSGNITPILSGLIAFSIYALIRRRMFGFSCAYILLLLFKTIGLTWLPVLLMNRRYWRALIYLAIISLLLNGIVVELAGAEVYKTFFSLVPKIAIPAGVGIVPSLLYLFAFYPRTLYIMINLVVVGFLYYGYWKSAMGKFFKCPVYESPLSLVALLAGAMALYCLINFSIWLPYSPNYLFFPFLGWILQEGYLASGYWRYFILGVTGFAFLVLASEWIVKGSLFYLLGKESVGWYHDLVFQPACVFFIPAFFLLVALRRLLSSVPYQNEVAK